jgi:peptide/nickel transport system substrate-binding protein
MLGALTVAALVVVASCGDDDDVGETTSGSAAVTAGSTTSGAEADSTAPATEAGVSDGEEAGGSEGERTSEDNGEPVKGGTLVYGLEADSANPWAPYRTSCATSCRAIFKAISDPLFSEDPDGEPVGYLVESFEPNADFTEWTLHIRDGITFHDDTPLDAAAVEFNIESCQYSPLTGSSFVTIDEVTSSGQDVVITTKGPWVALPAAFLDYDPCSFMFSPTWLGTLEDIPQRDEAVPVYDAALAATPADGDPAKPVALGAFEFESYSPGNANSFVAVRNDDYWRGANGVTNEDLPYLDGIEFVVAVDADSRTNATRSGQFDLMMTANGDTISEFLDDDDFKVDSSTKFGDTAYIMLNTATGEADPEGTNADSPLLNVNCRRALAFAIDQERWAQERTAGLNPPANGPFPPGSTGYLDDSGYPQFDVAEAQALMDTCLSELGTDHIEFTFNTTNDPFNVESNTLIQSMWTDAFGDQVQVTIAPIEQGQYIGLALVGDFNAQGWRSHFGADPDAQRKWWQSAGASPIGELALNFGRFKDPVIDEAFNTIQTDPDPEARKAAAEAINREFGEQVWNWWLTWVIWAIVQQPYVNGVQQNQLPDGSEGIGLAFLGVHNMNQMWCDEGSCE